MGSSIGRLLESSGGIVVLCTIDVVGSSAAREAANPALSHGGRLVILRVAQPGARVSVSRNDICARGQVFITPQARA